MREGIWLYFIVILLSFLVSLAGLAVDLNTLNSLSQNGVSFDPFHPPTNETLNLTNSTALGSTSGAYVALQGVEVLVGFVAFVLLIIAWLKWREGIRAIARSSGEYGPVHATEAEQANRDYGRTVWMFAAILISTVAGVIVAAAIVVSALVGSFTTSSTTINISSFWTELVVFVICFAVFLTFLNFLMYYFSSRSLKGEFYSLASPETKAQMESARLFMLIGAIIPFFGMPQRALCNRLD